MLDLTRQATPELRGCGAIGPPRGVISPTQGAPKRASHFRSLPGRVILSWKDGRICCLLFLSPMGNWTGLREGASLKIKNWGHAMPTNVVVPRLSERGTTPNLCSSGVLVSLLAKDITTVTAQRLTASPQQMSRTLVQHSVQHHGALLVHWPALACTKVCKPSRRAGNGVSRTGSSSLQVHSG